MSLFTDIDEVSCLTTEAIHADLVTLKDGAGLVLNPSGCYGYAEELPVDPFESARTGREVLHIANDRFDHIIHIRRAELAGVTIANVNKLIIGAKEYRVEHFKDQPTRAEVELYCKLT